MHCRYVPPNLGSKLGHLTFAICGPNACLMTGVLKDIRGGGREGDCDGPFSTIAISLIWHCALAELRILNVLAKWIKLMVTRSRFADGDYEMIATQVATLASKSISTVRTDIDRLWAIFSQSHPSVRDVRRIETTSHRTGR